MNLLGKRVFVVVTGSSRGFGQAIADRFVKALIDAQPKSVSLVVHGRRSSAPMVNRFANSLFVDHVKHPAKADLFVRPVFVDLQDPSTEELGTMVKSEWDGHFNFDYAFLFNNAGVLLPGSLDSLPHQKLVKSMAVNAYSMQALAKVFLQEIELPTKRYIIHTSSIAALRPFPSWGAYCISKAASHMMHKVIAAENPGVRVLQYSPGPLETRMTEGIQGASEISTSVKESFARMEREGALLQPQESAEKLVSILLADQFVSGEQIDFYDV